MTNVENMDTADDIADQLFWLVDEFHRRGELEIEDFKALDEKISACWQRAAELGLKDVLAEIIEARSRDEMDEAIENLKSQGFPV